MLLLFVFSLFFVPKFFRLPNSWLAAAFLLLSMCFLKPLLTVLAGEINYSWVILPVSMIGLGISIATLYEGYFLPLLSLTLTFIIWIVPFDFKPQQKLYADPLVGVWQTRQGEIHEVRWKDRQWLYYNQRLTKASVDEHLYYEPLVHPMMHLISMDARVLLVGGENGACYREISKYPLAQPVDILPLDVGYFKKFNPPSSSFNLITKTPFDHLSVIRNFYDAIIIDLPDPVSLELNQYYTFEFYALCHETLRSNGFIVTQAGSPYTLPAVYFAINETIDSANFHVLNFHNQVPTLGQWGWVMGSKSVNSESLKKKLAVLEPTVPTKWWTREAMNMMLSFGKNSYFYEKQASINAISNPILPQLFTSMP